MSVNNEEIVVLIEDVFVRKGADSYLGEQVTMSQHMLQSAALAEQSGADEALICAALLHDIGHYASEFPADMIEEGQDNFHQTAGAQLLAPFFTTKITDCIRYHVDAKRYLCTVDESYYQKLSQASKDTLRLQGGAMSVAEVEIFQQLANLDDIIQVRLWDDLAKDPLQQTPNFEYYRPMLINQLST